MQTEVNDNRLMLRGEVSVRTVNRAACEPFLRLIKQPEIDTLDLSGVERADSACVSLLLNALREKSSLKIHALPESVRALVELYEIEEWVTS